MYDHLMLDIETLAQVPTSVVISIAAVAFNMDNDERAEFYTNVDARDCKRYGMTISKDTIDWWRKQSAEAALAWISNGVPVKEAGQKLVDFISTHTVKKDVWVWSQGIDFDLPIIKNLLMHAEVEEPWCWWNQMDTRTIFKMSGFNTKHAPRVGKYHNALDDCHNQINWLKTIANGTS